MRGCASRSWFRGSAPPSRSDPALPSLTVLPLTAAVPLSLRRRFLQDEVPMYVHEESFEGRKLHDVINERHENPKYLPGITLPDNIVADSDIRRVVSGAHVLVFVMPHQFIKGLCQRMQGHVTPGAKAISLVKGFDCENNQINLMSEYIRKTLGIECCSLSGANVAEGVAQEQFRSGTRDRDAAIGNAAAAAAAAA